MSYGALNPLPGDIEGGIADKVFIPAHPRVLGMRAGDDGCVWIHVGQMKGKNLPFGSEHDEDDFLNVNLRLDGHIIDWQHEGTYRIDGLPANEADEDVVRIVGQGHNCYAVMGVETLLKIKHIQLGTAIEESKDADLNLSGREVMGNIMRASIECMEGVALDQKDPLRIRYSQDMERAASLALGRMEDDRFDMRESMVDYICSKQPDGAFAQGFEQIASSGKHLLDEVIQALPQKGGGGVLTASMRLAFLAELTDLSLRSFNRLGIAADDIPVEGDDAIHFHAVAPGSLASVSVTVNQLRAWVDTLSLMAPGMENTSADHIISDVDAQKAFSTALSTVVERVRNAAMSRAADVLVPAPDMHISIEPMEGAWGTLQSSIVNAIANEAFADNGSDSEVADAMMNDFSSINACCDVIMERLHQGFEGSALLGSAEVGRDICFETLCGWLAAEGFSDKAVNNIASATSFDFDYAVTISESTVENKITITPYT